MRIKIKLALVWIFCLAMSWNALLGAEQGPVPDEISSIYQKGQEEFRVHHFKEAEALFKKALDRKPTHCQAFMGLFHVYLIAEDLKNLKELMSRSSSLEGCTESDHDYLQAVQAEGKGKLNEAVDRYESIVKRDPGDARAATYAALIYLSLKQYTSGIEASQQAIKADPNFFLAHNVLGRISKLQGNPVGAMDEFKKALDIFPDYAFGHASLGEVLLKQKKVEEAKAHFQQAERLEPQNGDLLAFIGNAFLDSGHKDEAIAYYQRSLAVNPENAMVHYYLARIYLDTGEDEKVEQEIEASLRYAPQLQGMYGLFGYIYLERNKLILAERYLKKQVELNPEDLQARNALSWVYFFRGDYDQAEAEAREMIKGNPELINGYNNLAHVLMEKGQFSQAIELFRKGISIQSEAAELHSGLAHALLKKGRLEESKSAAEHALKLNAKALDARLTLGLVFVRKGEFNKALKEVEALSEAKEAPHLSSYLLGQIALERKENDRAIEGFRKARDLFPSMSAEYLRSEALGHLQKGDLTASIEASQQAIAVNPRFALAYHDLGLAHYKLGDKVRAREALQKFLELWKGADADLPEVIEAQKLLKELGS